MAKQGALKTIGLVAGIVATSALTILAQPAFAKKAAPIRKQPPISSYRLSDNVRIDCVERCF